MAYVEVAVWFGRETGVEPAAVFAGLKIFEHKLLYKAESLGFWAVDGLLFSIVPAIL